MAIKDWITVAFILVISAVAMLSTTEKADPKMLQQKIVMTSQTVDTLRSNANTYAGVTPTKDYANINMVSLRTAGIIDYNTTGAGGTSTITAPFDSEMTFAIAPVSGNKRFTVTIENTTNTSMDATQLQQWKDNLLAYASAGAGTGVATTRGVALTFSR